MLTISSKGRVFDYSHAVGGRPFRGITYISKGPENSMFVVFRDAYNSGILCVEGINISNSEEISTKFSPINANPVESWPTCIASDDSGVYVTDELQNKIDVFDFSGTLINEIRIHGEKSSLNKPSGLAIHKNGEIFVTNTGTHEILKLNPNGSLIARWGGKGNDDGKFHSPWGLCLTHDNSVLVADHLNNRIQKFTATGNHLLTIGESGLDTNTLNHPSDVATDSAGDIYVADWVNNRIQIYDKDGYYVLSMYGSANELSKWQKQYVNGNPDVHKARRRVASLELETFFALPTCVEYDDINDRLYVVDSQRWRIQVFEKLDGYSQPQFNI